MSARECWDAAASPAGWPGGCRPGNARSADRPYPLSPGAAQDERLWATVRTIFAKPEAPVKAIAEKVGYESRSGFTRAFRTAYGVSPAAYRASQNDAVP